MTSNLPGFKDVPQSIKLTSPDFEHGSPIPIKHAGKGVGDNLSPALKWEGVPAGTKELAIVLEVDASLHMHTSQLQAILRGYTPCCIFGSDSMTLSVLCMWYSESCVGMFSV